MSFKSAVKNGRKHRVVGYARTSSMANDIKGQVNLLAGKTNGHVVKDKGVSGTVPICERKSWTDLADLGVSTVFVKNAKRFARSLLVQETGIQWADERGIKIISLDRPSTFTDRTRRGVMMGQIEAAINEADKGEVVDNLARGRAAAVRNNKQTKSYLTLSGKAKCSGRRSLLQVHGSRLVRAVKSLLKKPFVLRKGVRTKKVISWSQISLHLSSKGFGPKSGKTKLLARSAIGNLLRDLDSQQL